MRRNLVNSKKIIFSGDMEKVRRWRKSGLRYPVFLIIVLIGISFLPVSGDIIKDSITFWRDILILYYGFAFLSILGTILLLIIVSGIIQPLRITERGIYPPTRGILNIFLMRERFIPFSKIKEFRVYNPWIEKFPDEWARMGKREREVKELMESDYNIVLKSGRVLKMSNWATALYFSKNWPSSHYVEWLKDFRDILLKINEELKKGKEVIMKEEVYTKDYRRFFQKYEHIGLRAQLIGKLRKFRREVKKNWIHHVGPILIGLGIPLILAYIVNPFICLSGVIIFLAGLILLIVDTLNKMEEIRNKGKN